MPQTREVTKPLVPPRPPSAPVFVDDTGRRGRLLAWASVAFAMMILVLIAAFWISQATVSSASVPADGCGVAAGAGCGAPAAP